MLLICVLLADSAVADKYPEAEAIELGTACVERLMSELRGSP